MFGMLPPSWELQNDSFMNSQVHGRVMIRSSVSFAIKDIRTRQLQSLSSLELKSMLDAWVDCKPADETEHQRLVFSSIDTSASSYRTNLSSSILCKRFSYGEEIPCTKRQIISSENIESYLEQPSDSRDRTKKRILRCLF